MKNGSGNREIISVVSIAHAPFYTTTKTRKLIKICFFVTVLQKADAPNGVAGNQAVAIDMDQYHNQQYQDQMFEEQVSG
jgi:hypothetical protein